MLQMAVLKKSAEETTEGANVGGAEMLRLERIARHLQLLWLISVAGGVASVEVMWCFATNRIFHGW